MVVSDVKRKSVRLFNRSRLKKKKKNPVVLAQSFKRSDDEELRHDEAALLGCLGEDDGRLH